MPAPSDRAGIGALRLAVSGMVTVSAASVSATLTATASDTGPVTLEVRWPLGGVDPMAEVTGWSQGLAIGGETPAP